jgi:hypothetical protein
MERAGHFSYNSTTYNARSPCAPLQFGSTQYADTWLDDIAVFIELVATKSEVLELALKTRRA